MQTNTASSNKLLKNLRELILVGLITGSIYLVLAPTDPNPFRPVTLTDLTGVWTSSDVRYTDRFLQFDGHTVTFGWGPDGQGSYAIRKIESERGDVDALVTIHYTDLDNSGYLLNFQLSRFARGSIRMKSQKDVSWARTSDKPIHATTFK